MEAKMARKPLTAAPRRPTDVTVSAGPDRQPADAQYAIDNRDKMSAWSAFFEENGLPLAENRQF
jgi:post-segregation antitoxin (ccd killing protein)